LSVNDDGCKFNYCNADGVFGRHSNPMTQSRVSRAGQDQASIKDRLLTSVQQLSESSKELKSAAEELRKVVFVFNSHLRSLEPHVATWHKIAGGQDEQGNTYWTRDIGFTEIRGVWEIAIRTVDGRYTGGGEELEESKVWSFSEAPHWMQIESVNKLPDLLEEIIKRTRETTSKLRAKTDEAKLLAEALTNAIAIQDLL
jgi:hypothetical protein